MSDLELVGERVLVVGLARSGRAAAEVLRGLGAEVVGFDRDPSSTWEGSASSVSKFIAEARRRRCYRGSISS